ncbi:hypothetical protein K461DRAFT_291801 [Myriangium duriaei CBS 260.36]|uniref:Uncharacterized protein n=1 Tax=Myriangium duriaei CBS 260.36 TaxID=1168546 RepID=A0A9P4J3S1_9PEZI|nr:hypothetical protein K461DRAFT_291801 [Myriangium duriaei CBS 260.36]
MGLHLFSRDEVSAATGDATQRKLLATLLALAVVGLLLTGALMFMRHRRRNSERRSSLPQYEEIVRPSSARSNHRRLAIRPESNYVVQEKQMLILSSDAPPPKSPVPEIRITLPEEMDHSGNRQSGRVVVVHVGESTMGFEPYDEKLPPYQQSDSDRFQSLDLERIGGLKEKEYR